MPNAESGPVSVISMSMKQVNNVLDVIILAECFVCSVPCKCNYCKVFLSHNFNNTAFSLSTGIHFRVCQQNLQELGYRRLS